MYTINKPATAEHYAAANGIWSVYKLLDSYRDQNAPLMLLNAMGRCYPLGADMGKMDLTTIQLLGLALQTYALSPEQVHDFVDEFVE